LVHIALLVAGRAIARLAGAVAVRAGLALVDLLTALTLVAALTAAATGALVAVVITATAGGGSLLALGVALVGVVVVFRGRTRVALVGLVHITAVRSRTVDRDGSVDVRLLRGGFARGGLFGGVLVSGSLCLLDQAADQTASLVARERCAR